MTRAITLTWALIAALLFGLAVAAAESRALDAERRAGLVGDQADGYMGIVKPPGTPDLQRKVDEINLKRREIYRQIAEKNGTGLAEVEAITGAELLERTPAGEYFRGADGAWRQR